MSVSTGKYIFVPDRAGDTYCYNCDEASSEKYRKQQLERGFGDDETFSIDYALSTFILPRLRRYRELMDGFPAGMTWEEWQKIVDEIIWFFEQYETDFDCPEGMEQKEYSDRVDGAQLLFGQYLRSLWW